MSIILIALSSSVLRSLHLYTIPNEPSPIFLSTLYLSSRMFSELELDDLKYLSSSEILSSVLSFVTSSSENYVLCSIFLFNHFLSF